MSEHTIRGDIERAAQRQLTDTQRIITLAVAIVDFLTTLDEGENSYADDPMFAAACKVAADAFTETASRKSLIVMYNKVINR